MIKMGEYAPMHGHYIERRSLASTTVSRDVAYHLYTRQLPGFITIVTERPEVFMASVSKQWAKVTRQVELQMASTLNPVRKEELIIARAHMQTLRFSVKPFMDDEGAGVFFASEEYCRSNPPVCHTLYVTEALGETTLLAVTAAMPAYGLVVLYD